MSGKKYADSLKAFDRETFYAPTEAINILKSIAKAKFDETVEVAIRLGVDPRKADQMVRGTVALPSGTGRDVRVAASVLVLPPMVVLPVQTSSVCDLADRGRKDRL